MKKDDFGYHSHCDACQRFYSIRTVAERWDLSQKTVRRMIQSGKLEAKRINGSVRIPHSGIVKAVNDI